MNYDDLFVRLRNISPSERIVYHIGFLASDRDRQHNIFGASAVNMLADEVFKLYRKKQVCLTQRKLGIGVYEYIATGANV